jgi:ABC-type molybdate transport system substrate-binding protein
MSAWMPVRPAAADVALTASNAINVVLEELVPQFERARGHKVTMRLGVASFLRKEIEDGAAFDVAILVGNLDRLVKDGKIAAGTPVALGRSGYGLAVRAGAPGSCRSCARKVSSSPDRCRRSCRATAPSSPASAARPRRKKPRRRCYDS